MPLRGGPGIAAARAAERQVVCGYVAADRREAFVALLALDDVLAGIVRTTREPIVGQMRLTWWYEALVALDTGTAPPGQPVLAALASHVRPRGIAGATLATMIDGWELLLDPDPLDADGLARFAALRGATLFAALAGVLNAAVKPDVERAGEGWALADLATHLSDPRHAGLARTTAIEALDAGLRDRWPVPFRPLGMLALLARADLAQPSPRPGSPRRLAQLLMHRIWGR